MYKRPYAEEKYIALCRRIVHANVKYNLIIWTTLRNSGNHKHSDPS